MYSYYSLEQVRGSDPRYQELENMLLALVKDPERKKQLESILYEGGIDGFSFSTRKTNKDDPSIEAKRRISMAYLLARNPETFDRIVANRINVFHGTNANALPSILKHGLNSIDESERLGLYVSTGETWSRIGGKRDFVSFTDVLDIAEGYATISPNQENQELSFEVILGTTVEDVESERTVTIHSDVPEIGVKNHFPRERIRIIAVPSDKIDIVRKLTAGTDIEVVAVDDTTKKFYYMDDMGPIYIDENLYQELQESIKRERKQFAPEEIFKMAKERGLSKIHEMAKKLRSWMSKEEEEKKDVEEYYESSTRR